MSQWKKWGCERTNEKYLFHARVDSSIRHGVVSPDQSALQTLWKRKGQTAEIGLTACTGCALVAVYVVEVV
jgi:hypothetical protein